MARPLRIEYPGAFYHVMSRGNAKQPIYLGRRDRTRFLGYLESATCRYQAVIHCYCLMENHYHLMIETPEGNLAQIMQHINGAYSVYFNKKHERVGHLYQGRYLAQLVDSENYCVVLSRYIHLNPVKQGLVEQPYDYEWSSSRHYLHNHAEPAWLQKELLYSLVGKRNFTVAAGHRADDDDVEASLPVTIEKMTGPVLGDEAFVEKIQNEYLRRHRQNRDHTEARAVKSYAGIQQIADRVALEAGRDGRLTKKMTIYICHRFSSYRLKDIADYFGIGESGVTLASQRFARDLSTDQRLAEKVAGLLAVLHL